MADDLITVRTKWAPRSWSFSEWTKCDSPGINEGSLVNYRLFSNISRSFFCIISLKITLSTWQTTRKWCIIRCGCRQNIRHGQGLFLRNKIIYLYNYIYIMFSGFGCDTFTYWAPEIGHASSHFRGGSALGRRSVARSLFSNVMDLTSSLPVYYLYSLVW
jgi:hypothetical protein